MKRAFISTACAVFVLGTSGTAIAGVTHRQIVVGSHAAASTHTKPRSVVTSAPQRSSNGSIYYPSAAQRQQIALGKQDAPALRYWTQSRMQNAVARTPKVSTQYAKQIKQDTSRREVSKPEDTAEPSATFNDVQETVAQVGKLYATDGNGNNFFCSATSIPSNNNRLVLTAAHCLFEDQVWSRNVVFVPADSNGSAPSGKFAAALLRAPHVWVDAGGPDELNDASANSWAEDVGFVTVYNGPKGDLNSTVGSQQFEYGDSESYNFSATFFGYPENINSGAYMIKSTAQTSQEQSGLPFYEVSSDFGDGSSGGPLFDNWNEKTKTGTIRSVISAGFEADGVFPDGADVFLAPHLGNWFESEYLAAYADWAGVWIADANAALCMHPSGGSQNQGAAVLQDNCNKTDLNYQWSFVPVSGYPGYSWIVNEKTGFYLNVKDGSTSAGGILQMYGCSTTADSDKWNLQTVKAHYTEGAAAQWVIQNLHSSMCVFPSGNSVNPGAALVQQSCNPTNVNDVWYTFPLQPNGIF